MKISPWELRVAAAAGAFLLLSSGGAATAMAQAPQGRFLDVLVRLDDAFSPGSGAGAQAAAAAIARSLGVEPRHAYGTVTFGFAGRVPEGRFTALSNDPRVRQVSLTRTVTIAERITAKPNCELDPSHKACGGDDTGGGQVTSWGYDRIGAGLLSNSGQGIHVFVLDTGIDSDHPDLQAHLAPPHLAIETCQTVSFPFISDCQGKEAWDDDHSHGTHVSGIIGALNNDSGIVGVAPNATLHAVKVLDWAGSGTDAGVIDGINWVVEQINASNDINAPVVINMSLGASGVSKQGTCDVSGYSPDDEVDDTYDMFHEAICNAARAGVVFVVAAGNDDIDAANAVPAAYDDAVITVSATMIGQIGRGKNKTEVDDWPSWSNWGDGDDRSTLASGPVALAAPGNNILSLLNDGGTGTKSGTSMAAPFVAGAAAAYLESPLGSPSGYGWFEHVRDALLNGAEETDATSSWNNSSGNPHSEDFLDPALLCGGLC